MPGGWEGQENLAQRRISTLSPEMNLWAFSLAGQITAEACERSFLLVVKDGGSCVQKRVLCAQQVVALVV
jgi:hypothetical protein